MPALLPPPALTTSPSSSYSTLLEQLLEFVITFYCIWAFFYFVYLIVSSITYVTTSLLAFCSPRHANLTPSDENEDSSETIPILILTDKTPPLSRARSKTY
ncbi:hypothetical protein CC78DRAFT_588013 [Lojkania enalia]|uniref:Uncharacterized protein n=1 Tax=Lojkania enalia TaxID=147567 RepID=A0A9P4MUF9_9PLEO|nr:hypothetical protein CC78DRAFT_588013 [Didymosphaeria enalia]